MRQGQLVLEPADADSAGQPGERSRPPLDADTTCPAVTGPITPTAPNRAVTAAVDAPTAASKSCHGDPNAFGTAWSTPANLAATRKWVLADSSRDAIRRNQPRTVDAGTPSASPIGR
jgi:hypothetical protein